MSDKQETKRNLPDLVPARMVNEVLYCERLMYLEWVQGEFADNHFTVEGRSIHRRVDTSSSPVPDPSDEEDSKPIVSRSVWLSSEKLGLTAKIDLMEHQGSVAIPVEFKRGKKPDLPKGAWPPELAQLCAQGLLLRDAGFTCERGEIYYAKDHQRVQIEFDEATVSMTLAAIKRARIVASGNIPAPLHNSPKCVGCSLSALCLPDEIDLLAAKSSSNENVRRLQPARDDRLPLYIQEQGARLSVKGGQLLVTGRTEKRELRVLDTSQVSVMGNVQITTQAMRTMLNAGIPCSFYSTGGWLYGRSTSFVSKNVELRIAQHRSAADKNAALSLAQSFVESKIRNCRTLLRRNGNDVPSYVLGELRAYAQKALEVESVESLLGIEGSAARLYFQNFSLMIHREDEVPFDFNGRNRRPPKDPVNALLSFCYALLTKDLVNAISLVGMDPLVGYLHQPRFGRPALALDLMEEFRPLVADSVVLSLINGGIVKVQDFLVTGAAVAMKDNARKKTIQAYERRMDQLVTHPIFGYRISYRRILEVQARLLGRVLLGELEEYPAFRTR